MNIGALMAGSNAKKKRDPYDHNPTQDWPVKTLIRYYRQYMTDRVIWEPCCAAGNICKVLSDELAVPIFATDIYHRGYGMGGINFMDVSADKITTPVNFVTNPPFNQAEEFIRHCLTFKPTFMAMFLKMQYWNAISRLPLYNETAPKAVHPLTSRVDFTGAGNPTMDCMWVVWGDVPFSHQPLEK